MKIVSCISLVLSVIPGIVQVQNANGQTYEEIAAIRRQLKYIHDRDQAARRGGDSAAFLGFIDSTNLEYIEHIIEKYGWPARTVFGSPANETVWLVIQHADIAVQEKYFPLMRASVEKNESSATELAYLEDRILMRHGKKQRYGTQVSYNEKTGKQELWPIEDEVHVNERRALIWLEPLEKYALNFGIDYKLPKE